MENLPSEVIINIMSRLPVKTIIHCKCVCKKWHKLVNNACFIKLHLARSRVGFMTHHDAYTLDAVIYGILKWVEIEDKHDHHSLHHEPVINFDIKACLAAPTPFTQSTPVSSLNGLICIWQRGINFGVNVDNIYICNPITKEYLTLPRHRNSRDGIVVYKFGVNSLTGEYKVLRVFQRGLPPTWPIRVVEAEVYTLGTSQWRSLGQVPYRIDGLNGPFLNGYFHWNAYDQDAPESIFTFDLDKEKFQFFPSPPTEPGARKRGWDRLGIFKSCLSKSYTYDSQFTIWVMKQYAVKESWHKELVITQAICDVRGWLLMKDDMYVFGGLQDGTFLVVNGNKVLAYCPKTKTFEDLEILGERFIILTHRPSFIKLQDIDPKRVHTF